ncbi:hypothetical protein ACIPL1_19550 [Pseudomonas sp. NPDC090202]|uniref:hypothetical protein n=1 Tax=unclassified Pseudomonas TaxID=196821 RepID=UPI003810646C
MTEELKAYVQSAAVQTVTVKVMDETLTPALKSLGFSMQARAGIVALNVIDDSQKARVFDALRQLGVAFSDGREWCPAEVFEYLRDKGLLSGTFVKVSWTAPGQIRRSLV